jgi:predicted nuclease with TOPRIM domain
LPNDETERLRRVRELLQIPPDQLFEVVLDSLRDETDDLRRKLDDLEEKVEDIRHSLRVIREMLGWNPEDLA